MNKKEFQWTPEWGPVFKKNNYKHDSGYNSFTTGYRNSKTGELHIIGHYTDHVWLSNLVNIHESLSLDVRKDGFIHIYALDSKYHLKWETDKYCLSTMQLSKFYKL